ncbi:DUF2225 domain-containing protein, partial [Tyzzerella sp. OttesenSCG-928-J15]|nr:DUF2225 domain-containing protein [Tyzzerella sp. OttesenSCG-928-J15]
MLIYLYRILLLVIELFNREKGDDVENNSTYGNNGSPQISSSELNKTIVKRNIDCPVCKAKFDYWDVASYKVRIVKSDTDLRNYFSPFDPLYYSVI